MGQSSSVYSIDTAVDGDAANKRACTKGEPVQNSPNRLTANHLPMGFELPRLKVETSGFDLEPPVSLLQRLEIHDWDNDEDDITLVDADSPDLVWSDCESEYRGRESSSGEGNDGNDDDGDIHMVIHEGLYADSIRELRRKEKSRFPVAMMVKLEANRLRTLNDLGVRNSPTTMIPPHRWYMIMHILGPLNGAHDANRDGESAVIGVAQGLDQANIKAMSYFCQNYHGYMCSLDARGHSRQNRVKSPFTEVKEYSDIQSFEAFYHTSGTNDCSAWGIDPAGCLGLLAVRGTECLSMVYVKETDYFP
ncbi:hypothetical protein F4805DRAFT_420632 [Annulohypoxylon moriforme]|nr:hypothetical protein F4805DRAFT_420632 [Annulohypoxylon moriforme]